MSRTVVQSRAKRTRRPLTDWSLKSEAERRAVVQAPFPPIQRLPGKTWAGTIVVNDLDDPLSLVYKPNTNDGDGSIDNLFRSLEG